MMTWEQIQEANKQIKTIDIKGKDYAVVNERIKAFRMIHPNGRIETEREYLIGDIGSRTVGFVCRVYDAEGNLLGNGHAEEHEASTFINKTSFIENCESSSVGRALAIGCALGVDTSIASAEEVQNAIANQEEPLITEGQMNVLLKMYQGENLDKLLQKNKLESLDKMTKSKASELISKLKEKRNA